MEGLNELLLQISNELGVGIEFLKANFIESLPEIGRYLLVKELLIGLIGISLGCTLVMVIPMAISVSYYHHKTLYTTSKEDEVLFNKLIKYNIFTYIIFILFGLMTILLPYLASPKFWTIQKLLEMVR